MKKLDQEYAERHEFYKSLNDTIVSRFQLAEKLGISPNRVSELVRMGVLEPVSIDPLLYSLEHSEGCYRDYQWWLSHRKRGERYASPVDTEQSARPSNV
jgi:transcriptional regulator with XRE-family HTH domain